MLSIEICPSDGTPHGATALSILVLKQFHNVDRKQKKPRNLLPLRRAWPLAFAAFRDSHRRCNRSDRHSIRPDSNRAFH